MINDVTFTTGTFAAMTAAIVASIFTLVFLLRRYLAHEEKINLTEKYRAKKWRSPLEARAKYPDVDSFRYRPYILRFSLVATLAIMVAAFNWTTYERTVDVSEYTLVLDEEIQVEPPRSQAELPPPPPPPPPVIAEVPDAEFIEEDDLSFMDMSMDANDAILNAPVASNKPPTGPVAPPPPPPLPKKEEPEEIFKVVEVMPRFPGCEDLGGSTIEKKECADRKLMEFIYSNIQYPLVARENNIEGTVVVRFVVNTDGRVGNIEVIRDIGGGCGEEAIRIVNLMNEMPETWQPGMQQGRPVRVLFNLPIKFKLL